MTSGTIGILSGDVARFTRFWASLIGVHAPGAHLILKIGNAIPHARNEILREAQGDWVWFVDDDHTFDVQLLERLLAWDVDIVQPVVLTRATPFGPVHMGPSTKDGKKLYRFALRPGDPPALKEVEAVGTGGMLVRRRVWESMEDPWFRYGDLQPDKLSEDIGFCQRAREKGWRVWCDLTNPLPHLIHASITPEWDAAQQQWFTCIQIDKTRVLIPQPEPKYAPDQLPE